MNNMLMKKEYSRYRVMFNIIIYNMMFLVCNYLASTIYKNGVSLDIFTKFDINYKVSFVLLIIQIVVDYSIYLHKDYIKRVESILNSNEEKSEKSLSETKQLHSQIINIIERVDYEKYRKSNYHKSDNDIIDRMKNYSCNIARRIFEENRSHDKAIVLGLVEDNEPNRQSYCVFWKQISKDPKYQYFFGYHILEPSIFASMKGNEMLRLHVDFLQKKGTIIRCFGITKLIYSKFDEFNKLVLAMVLNNHYGVRVYYSNDRTLCHSHPNRTDFCIVCEKNIISQGKIENSEELQYSASDNIANSETLVANWRLPDISVNQTETSTFSIARTEYSCNKEEISKYLCFLEEISTTLNPFHTFYQQNLIKDDDKTVARLICIFVLNFYNKRWSEHGETMERLKLTCDSYDLMTQFISEIIFQYHEIIHHKMYDDKSKDEISKKIQQTIEKEMRKRKE